MTIMTAPYIGQFVTVHGLECRIIAIRPMGTIDVETTDGTCRCFRVSGLALGSYARSR